MTAHTNNIRDTTAEDVWPALRKVPQNLTGQPTMKPTSEYAIPRLELNLVSHEHEGMRIRVVLPRSAFHMDI